MRGGRDGRAGAWLRVLGGAALVLLAYVVASSLTRPLFYWDSWAYHLPFSALLWNLGDSARTFVLGDGMRARYEGFPLLAEFVQGALWKLTGTINATALVNSVGLAAFVLAAGRSLRVSVALLAFGALAVPLVALHSTSTYIDLFVAVCVCLQVLAAVHLEKRIAPGPPGGRSPIAAWSIVYLAAAAAAGNAKVTGLVLSLAVSAFLIAQLLRRRDRPGSRAKIVIACVGLASVLAAGTALKNVYLYSNPVYPFDVHVMGAHLTGPEPEYRNYPDYTASLGPLSRPANWLLSISEVDWLVRGVEKGYSLDSANGDKPLRHGPARTGGYWGPLVIVTLILAIALAVLALRRSRDALRSSAFLLALFVWLSLVAAFMPQSHELRYYLHWPLMLMLVVAVLADAAGLSAKARAMLAAAYLCAFIGSQAMLNFPLRVWPISTQMDSVEMQTRAEGAPDVDDVRSRGATCLGPEHNPRQFAYAPVFHGGDYIVEQGWKRCALYEPYVKENLR